MKKVILMLSVALVISIGGIASANYISNPGFEVYTSSNDFANWREGGSVLVNLDPQFVYEGSASAFLRVPGGNVYQDFTITDGGSLYYGAWFRIATDSYSSNWDQVQISLQIDSLAWTTIGGSVGNFVTNWTYMPAYKSYFSDWFLVASTVPVASIPMDAHININAQNTDSELTKVFVDSAFARSVPEPLTILLLGLGLVGIAGIRKKM